MSEHLHISVLLRLRSVVQSARIVSISCDEVTTVNNTSWIGIHVYTMEGWKRVSHVSTAGIASNLTTVIMDALINEGGLSTNEIAEKVIYFWANGEKSSTVQGTIVQYE